MFTNHNQYPFILFSHHFLLLTPPASGNHHSTLTLWIPSMSVITQYLFFCTWCVSLIIMASSSICLITNNRILAFIMHEQCSMICLILFHPATKFFWNYEAIIQVDAVFLSNKYRQYDYFVAFFQSLIYYLILGDKILKSILEQDQNL